MQKTVPITNIQNEEISHKINRIDTFMFCLCIIDTLFFPYIRVVSASLSMICLPIWYIFNMKKIKITNEFKLFILLTLFMILSVLMSIAFFPQYVSNIDGGSSSIWVLNIRNLIIILYGFLYYFFYSYYFNISNFSLKKILVVYIIFGLALGLIYIINASLYFQVRSFWTMSGNIITVSDSLLIYRYTGTFSDPNNAATAFITVLTFLLFNEKMSLVKNLYLILATALIVFATMSSTGFVIFGLMLIIFVIRLFKTAKLKNKIKISTLLSVSLIILTLPLLYLMTIKFFDSDVAKLALYRFSNNSASSRTEIWIELLNSKSIFNFIFYGMGGIIIIDGYTFAPHNGHLHMIYNYGMIAYTIFMYIFFRIRKNIQLQYYLFIIPLFIGFTMNVGIYEPRFVTLLALLVAAYGSKKVFFKTITNK